MANEIMTFKNEMFGEVRTMTDEKGEPLFCLSDVCFELGLRTQDVKRRLEDEVVSTHPIIDSMGRQQLASFVNEDGLYDVILDSRKPEAKMFRKWVTSEVLPQIRKTGGYIPVKEEDDEKTILAKAVGILKRTLEQKEELIEAQKPKVQFAEAVINSEDSILIRDLAKLIASNGIEIGQTRLFRWMREHGYLFVDGTNPIQKWVDKGLFVVDETVYDDGRRIRLNSTTRVTGKGQEYFVNGFVSGKFNVKDINSRRV